MSLQIDLEKIFLSYFSFVPIPELLNRELRKTIPHQIARGGGGGGVEAVIRQV